MTNFVLVSASDSADDSAFWSSSDSLSRTMPDPMRLITYKIATLIKFMQRFFFKLGVSMHRCPVTELQRPELNYEDDNKWSTYYSCTLILCKKYAG